MDHERFAGFPPDSVRFLAELAANNSRDWFTARRERCRASLEVPAAAALDQLVAGLSRRQGQALSGKVFRMHRDVRFSRDKTPYNTHLRMAIGFKRCEGSREDQPYWFFSLEPDTLILGAGVHAFGPQGLEAWRAAVADRTRGARLERILAPLLADGSHTTAPELKRVPAGWPQDHQRAHLLRCKGMAVWRELPHPAELFGPDAVEWCLSAWKPQEPLLAWLMALYT